MVVKGLRNANFDKIQIYLTTDKEQQMQKPNSTLEKERVRRK